MMSMYEMVCDIMTHSKIMRQVSFEDRINLKKELMEILTKYLGD